MSAISWGTKINDASRDSLFLTVPFYLIFSLSFLLRHSWSFILSHSDLTDLTFCHLNILSSLILQILLFNTSVSLLFYLSRRTNYAQKPWRILWIRCGMKRWCITASREPTWPPKRSGRFPGSELLPGPSMLLFPRQPNEPFIMWNIKIHTRNQ